MSTTQTQRSRDRTGLSSLLTGGLATLFASACCLGPLALITLGVSGAWIGKFTVLEPFQPLFIGAALIALFFAGKRIWRPVAECAAGEFCAVPHVRRGYKCFFVGICALLLITLVFPLIAPWFY